MVSEKRYVVKNIIRGVANLPPALLRRRPQAANLLKGKFLFPAKLTISVHEFGSKTYMNQLADGNYMVCPLVGNRSKSAVLWFSKDRNRILEYDSLEKIIY